MFDDINAYFHENVLDTYVKYVKVKNSHNAGKSDDLRSALNAASTLFHLREHIPTDKRKTRKALSNLCSDFDLLGDIVNVSKHRTISQNRPQITKAENLYEQIIITLYKDKKGEYQHVEKSVFALLDNGTERDLFEIITNVLNMWLVDLHSVGILDKIKPFEIKQIKIPARSKNLDKLNLKIIRGVRFHQRWKFQRYNYEKGIIEPVDLTGSEIQFNVYKPLFTMVLNVKDNKTGEETNLEIKVDEKQKKMILKLKTEEEKLTAFFKMAKEQGVISDYNIGTGSE
jgi:hypothetical protein